MAKTRIKILTTDSNASAPSNLKVGEFAHSSRSASATFDGTGHRLYIGAGTESGGIASAIHVIGGKYFTDLLDHAAGTLTAGNAIIVDSNKKINELLVDNIKIDGNAITSTDTNGNITLSPNGTGKLILGDRTGANLGDDVHIGDGTTTLEEFIFDKVGGAVTGGAGITVTNSDANNTSTVALTAISGVAGTTGSATAIPVLTINDKGQITAVTTAAISSSFTLAADSGSNDTFSNGETLTISGTTNEIETAVSNNEITIGLPNNVTIGNNLSVTGNTTVTGNLIVNGTTTTVNSTTVTIDDPIFTLGGDTAPSSDDEKDRGIEFRWHTGSAAKLGFFGMDEDDNAFTFIPDATDSSETYSGTAGNVKFGGGTFNNVTVGSASSGEISTASGNLTLDSAGGTVTVDDNLSVTGTVSLTNDLAVAHGGTGRSSFSAKAIAITTSADTFSAGLTSSTEGAIVQFNASGAPIASDIIDGGTY